MQLDGAFNRLLGIQTASASGVRFREVWVVAILAEATVASPELLQDAGNGFDLVLNDALKNVSGIGLLPVIPPNCGDCPQGVALSDGAPVDMQSVRGRGLLQQV